MSDYERREIDRTNSTDAAPRTGLPVTGEIGSEGGSFADPTGQVATFHDAVEQVREDRAAESPASQAVRSEDAGAPGGFVRYPTEAPADPSAPAVALEASGRAWRTGLIGAAAGFALGIVIHRFSRRPPY